MNGCAVYGSGRSPADQLPSLTHFTSEEIVFFAQSQDGKHIAIARAVLTPRMRCSSRIFAEHREPKAPNLLYSGTTTRRQRARQT